MEKCLSFFVEPIKSVLKWLRLLALANAANAAKGTPAGHRVYLRSITLMEIELGIMNEDNYEMREGYISSPYQFLTKVEEKKDKEVEPEEEKQLFAENDQREDNK